MMGTQKIKVSDHTNGLGCDNSDDFVIDVESFSHPTCKDVTSNPRITLQRSLSRKGSQRWNEEKVIVTTNPDDKNDGPCVVATLSPRGTISISPSVISGSALSWRKWGAVDIVVVVTVAFSALYVWMVTGFADFSYPPFLEDPKASVTGAGMQDPMCSLDHSSKTPGHHQITIITNGSGNDNRFNLRRNSFRRGSSSWTLDPKRILIIFATLSSMGTILLIYFTLSMSKPAGNGGSFDIQE